MEKYKFTEGQYSNFKMLILMLALCAFSNLQGDSLEASQNNNKDRSEESSLLIDPPEEIAALDMSLFLEHSKISLPDTSPIFDLRPPKNSFVAVSLSTLMPGLGHLYLGDIKTAASLIGISGLGVGGVTFSNSKEVSFLILQNTWCYGIYAAYRDIREYNGQAGYFHRMPKDSFDELAGAPFSLKILRKPEVWGGLLGKFALAFTIAYLALPKESTLSDSWANGMRSLVAFPVGLGEESFFRGFIQSQLSEMFTPWGGICLSSLIFGAVHIPNARGLAPDNRLRYYTFGIPLITLGGLYYGWLTYKNQSLQESVALHTWYDFILIALGSFAGQAAITGGAKWAVALPF